MSDERSAACMQDRTEVRVARIGGGAIALIGILSCAHGESKVAPLPLRVEPANAVAPACECCGSKQVDLPSSTNAGNFDEAPEVLTRVESEYPDIAKEAGVDGTVKLKVLVCSNGSIHDVQVVRGKSVPMLEAAAISSVRKWRFKPARNRGFPVAAWFPVDVKFELP